MLFRSQWRSTGVAGRRVSLTAVTTVRRRQSRDERRDDLLPFLSDRRIRMQRADDIAPFGVEMQRPAEVLEPVGFTMFRSVWDDGTAEVMGRLGAPGADIELRPTRIYSQKPPVKPRGWEAKRQGPKYRQLWKYTKRIKGVSNARGWSKKR